MNAVLEQLETLRTRDLDVAIETLRTILDEQLEIDDTVETYAGGTDQELEKRAYALTEEVLESFETMTATSSQLSPLALFTRAFDGEPNPYTTTDVPHDAPECGLFVTFLEEELSREGDDRPSLFGFLDIRDQ